TGRRRFRSAGRGRPRMLPRQFVFLPRMRRRILQVKSLPSTAACTCDGGQMAVADKVKSIIVEQLGVDEEEVTADASFVDDLGAASLDTVELVMAFEEEFGIEIPDEDAEKITRVKEAVEYIESHAKTKKKGNGQHSAGGRHGHRPRVVARDRDRRELEGAQGGVQRRHHDYQVRR